MAGGLHAAIENGASTGLEILAKMSGIATADVSFVLSKATLFRRFADFL